MLTADAYGAMPPIARLTPEGAMYHFLSGYTARVAGTERGVTEPKATFSTCFGAPFLPLNPNVYAKMLGERIAAHKVRVWLVNTGWTGGPYGVGSRMKIGYTRAMITAALSGQLDHVSYHTHDIFNLDIPATCPGVPDSVLDPRSAWPVLNRAAVDYAIKAALALGCDVQPLSIFARKNYFYPDLPKGYQISQYERPLALGGGLDISVGGRITHVGLTRIHMEEDAGKSLHEGFPDSDRRTYIDYNRSGVPLIEIVSEPDMRSAADAAEFFSRLRAMLVWLGVNDGNMEEGSLRCDANVSVGPFGATTLGTKD